MHWFCARPVSQGQHGKNTAPEPVRVRNTVWEPVPCPQRRPALRGTVHEPVLRGEDALVRADLQLVHRATHLRNRSPGMLQPGEGRFCVPERSAGVAKKRTIGIATVLHETNVNSQL